MNKKTIFIAITHGWHARMLLRTSFIKNLKDQDKYNIVILSQNADDSSFQKEFGYEFLYEKISDQGGYLWSRTNHLRRMFLLNSKITSTINIRINAYKRSHFLSFLIIKFFNYLFSFSKIFVKLFKVFDNILFPDKNFKSIFQQFKPDLLIISSIVHNQGFYMLRCAKNLNVKTLFFVESWDNPTSKMGFSDYPDKYVVWNHLNKQELSYYCNISEDDIVVTGSSYHDIYAKKETFCSKVDFSKRYGLDPNKKILTIAASHDDTYPQFDLFIKELYFRCNENFFGEDIQILIRPHPQTITGYSSGAKEEDLKKYKTKYPNIYFDIPKIVSNNLPVDIHASDIKRLAEIFYHSDLVISFLSTTSIDACILDKPVILTGFDYDNNLSGLGISLRTMLKYDHLDKLISSGGVRVANDFNELYKYIKMYITDPSIDSKNRARLVKEQCYKIDGNSGERMANFVKKYLDSI